ncbi:MAG: YbjQ family protein [Gammaproteobacteria bacterium]
MDLYIFLILLMLGYGFGQYAEKRHYRSIRDREDQYRNQLMLIQTRIPPRGKNDSAIVMGSVVISIDYFKRFLAGLRAFFGGRVKSYENLIDRARREAILRMQEEAISLGADKVINIKLETASISKGRRQKIGSIEVLAYGTALIPKTGE